IEQRFPSDFASYFSAQWPHLVQMQSNGLLEINEHSISITAPGRLYTLAVCQLFDEYLAQDNQQTPVLTQVM
ncbi:MAG: hypothetical protein GXX06_11380, partial [Gammaproteobacteria bacterium]|nr:hypothetical protein [Gammaproteobacteria bacterium]